jgi:hypothetical protein
MVLPIVMYVCMCVCMYVFMWNLVSDIKATTQTEDIWEQGAEENIWAEERWSGMRLEETA